MLGYLNNMYISMTSLLAILLDQVLSPGPLDDLVVNVRDVHDIMHRVAKVILEDPTQDVKAHI